MSIELMSRVFKEVDLPCPAKFVLVKLCDHADARGLAWPSIRRLAYETGQSVSTVKKALRRFREEKILVVRNPSRGGRGRARVYVIDIGRARSLYPLTPYGEICENGPALDPFTPKATNDSEKGSRGDLSAKKKDHHLTPNGLPPDPKPTEIVKKEMRACDDGAAAQDCASVLEADGLPNGEWRNAVDFATLDEREQAMIAKAHHAGWRITRANWLWLAKSPAVRARLNRTAWSWYVTTLPLSDDGSELAIGAFNRMAAQRFSELCQKTAEQVLGRRIRVKDATATRLWETLEQQRKESRDIATLLDAAMGAPSVSGGQG